MDKAALLVNGQYLLQCQRALGITVDVTQLRRLLEEQFGITFSSKWVVHVDGEVPPEQEAEFVRRLQLDSFQVKRHQVPDWAAQCQDRLRRSAKENASKRENSIPPARAEGVDVCFATRMLQLLYRANFNVFVVLAGDLWLESCLDLVRNDETRTVYIAHFDDPARCGRIPAEMLSFAAPFRGEPGYINLCTHLDRFTLRGLDGKAVEPKGWEVSKASQKGEGKEREKLANDLIGNTDLFFAEFQRKMEAPPPAPEPATEPPSEPAPAPVVAADPLVTPGSDPFKRDIPADPLMAAMAFMPEPPPPPDVTANTTGRPPPLPGFDGPFAFASPPKESTQSALPGAVGGDDLGIDKAQVPAPKQPQQPQEPRLDEVQQQQEQQPSPQPQRPEQEQQQQPQQQQQQQPPQSQRPPQQQQDQLPPGWAKYFDQARSAWYYVFTDPRTGQVHPPRWEPPSGMAPTQQQPPQQQQQQQQRPQQQYQAPHTQQQPQYQQQSQQQQQQHHQQQPQQYPQQPQQQLGAPAAAGHAQRQAHPQEYSQPAPQPQASVPQNQQQQYAQHQQHAQQQQHAAQQQYQQQQQQPQQYPQQPQQHPQQTTQYPGQYRPQ